MCNQICLILLSRMNWHPTAATPILLIYWFINTRRCQKLLYVFTLLTVQLLCTLICQLSWPKFCNMVEAHTVACSKALYKPPFIYNFKFYWSSILIIICVSLNDRWNWEMTAIKITRCLAEYWVLNDSEQVHNSHHTALTVNSQHYYIVHV